ncbi:MAG: MBOAT family protein, partial [Clostridia bacterium]|nr:MBOAT family protein [Clostridia bacterium]
MVFSSLMFLFRFLPIAFLIYYLTPRKFKNFVLLVESLIFYAWGEVRYLPIMIFSMVLDYTVSNLMDKYRGRKGIMKLLLACSMVGNLGMLVFFKYTDFLLGNIGDLLGISVPTLGLTLPLGISFYTFQTMSYTIDVYRGRFTAEKNFISFGAFVVLFPQLIAGPIVRYSDIKRELSERTMNPKQISDGLVRFITGVGKKVLIANSIGLLWTEVSEMPVATLSGSLAWLGVLAFGLQIYFDFSGYSDMAIGLGKMLGFDFPENFNLPYISRIQSLAKFRKTRYQRVMGKTGLVFGEQDLIS